jgi:hypothetical protein
MSRAEALDKIAELIDQEKAILSHVSAQFSLEELLHVKACFEQEINFLQALRDEVCGLCLEEYAATGDPN